MADLVKTSSLSGADQLGAILSQVVQRNQIMSVKTAKKAKLFLEELQMESSDLYVVLKDIPALRFSA